jgi:hypothetical protein
MSKALQTTLTAEAQPEEKHSLAYTTMTMKMAQ